MAHVSASSKIKKHVENNIVREVKEAKRRKTGYRLVRGESAGKLAIRTEEWFDFNTKKEAMEYIASFGGKSVKVEKDELDEHTEGIYLTIEVWKILPKNSEAYYWFIDKI